MKLCVRLHDLGTKGIDELLADMDSFGLDGAQLVAYKALDDVPYAVGSITREKAREIGEAFKRSSKSVALVGAYFNPVHSDTGKRNACRDIFADYLRICRDIGCKYVGTETGSYNDDSWTYNPKNRTEQALKAVADAFAPLLSVAEASGSQIALEGAAGHVCHNPEALQRVRNMLSTPTRVIFDLLNYMDETNSAHPLDILSQGIDLFGSDILLFHIKDWVTNKAGTPVQVPFGTGEADAKGILRLIKSLTANPTLVLEGTLANGVPHAVKTLREAWEQA